MANLVRSALLRRMLRVMALLAGLAIVGLALVIALAIPIDLTLLRGRVEAAASGALGRDVELRGRAHVVLSLWPRVEVADVRIANPEGFEADFARAKQAALQLAVLPLLRGEVRIREIRLAGVELGLETDENGRNNWTFAGAGSEKSPTNDARSGADLLEVGKLSLEEIEVGYLDRSTGRRFAFEVAELVGTLGEDGVVLDLSGSVEGHPYEVFLRSDDHHVLLARSEPFGLGVDGVVGGVPLHGELRLGPDETGTDLSLKLSATPSEIGDLAEIVTGGSGIEGRFGALALEFSARGARLEEAAESAALEFRLEDAALSYGNAAGERPVGLTLKEMSVSLAPGARGRAQVVGTLLEEPFALRAETGTARDWIEEVPWPLDVEATAAATRMELHGEIGTAERSQPTRLQIEVAGERLGTLAPWLGFGEGAPSSFALRGELVGAPGDVTIRSLEARLGRTSVEGELVWARGEGAPRVKASLHFAAIDPAELEASFTGSERDRVRDEREGRLEIDVPILPASIEIVDLELDLRADRVHLPRTDLTDVALETHIGETGVGRSPFHTRYGNARFDGELDLVLAAAAPVAHFRVETREVDVGALLRDLGVAEDFDSRADELRLDLVLRGESLRALFRDSELRASVTGGEWILDDPSFDGSVTVEFQRGELRAEPGKPVALALDARIGPTPLTIEMESSPLAEWLEQPETLPLAASARTDGAHLELAARIGLPLRLAEGEVDFSFRSERLDALNELTAVSLPPFGPTHFRGVARRDRGGGYGAGIEFTIGNSALEGDLALRPVEGRPTVDVELVAPKIQLDDFALDDWSPAGRTEEPDAPAGGEDTGFERRALLDPAVLSSFDASLTVRVDEVLSGNDSLGRGSLELALRDGKIRLDPLDLALPGGEVAITAALAPRKGSVSGSMTARIEHFEYGVLARRRDPETKMGGSINLDVALEAAAPEPAQLLAHANGHVDLAIWPEHYEAGVIDFWAANVVRTALRVLIPTSGSLVNCAVAALDFENGLATSRTILVDTTRVRVVGSGWADLGREKLRFEFAPIAKQAQLLALDTPVVVEGGFGDFSAGVTPQAALGTLTGLVTGLVTVPLEWIFGSSLPPDAVCKAALESSRP